MQTRQAKQAGRDLNEARERRLEMRLHVCEEPSPQSPLLLRDKSKFIIRKAEV